MITLRVLITEPIINTAIEKLENHFEVVVGKRDEYNDESALIKASQEFDAILTMLSNPVSRQVLNTGRGKLKIVANYAVGFNNIDTEAAREFGIHVSNTPGVLTESTAEIALALLLDVARKTRDAENYLRAGEFKGWEPNGFLGLELHGAKIGIIGLGRIGAALAKRAKACGMEISYHSRNRAAKNLEDILQATYYSQLDRMLPVIDVLSIHCPLTDDTHHLINRKMLALLPDHAIVINTSRGAVIDEAALADALHSSVIGGAGLDVFENEPEIHPDILTAPNTVVLPHIGSATQKSRTAMGELAANAIIGVLNGKKVPNLLA